MVQAVDHAEKLYGNSKPKFEPELRVETRPVEGTGDSKGHSYFVYRDENGKEWALSGTHERHPSVLTGYSQLVIHIKPLDESIDARGDQTPEQRGSRVLSSGAKAREGWRDLKQMTKKIEREKFEYNIFGANSNAVVYLGLQTMGFDPDSTMPTHSEYDADDHPGVGHLLRDQHGDITDVPDFYDAAKNQVVDYLQEGWNRRAKAVKTRWDKSTANLDKSLDKFQQTPQYFEDRIMRKVHREAARQR